MAMFSSRLCSTSTHRPDLLLLSRKFPAFQQSSISLLWKIGRRRNCLCSRTDQPPHLLDFACLLACLPACLPAHLPGCSVPRGRHPSVSWTEYQAKRAFVSVRGTLAVLTTN